ncbi:MAG: monovalent cation/H(+) antiporter subunit G [Rhodospirillaceae bacterium]
MDAVINVASWALLIGGGVFCIIGAIGLLRMPDPYTRLHAASVMDTLGVGLTLAGLILQAGFTLIAAKLVVIGLLLFFTSPVAGHAVARAMIHRNVQPVLARNIEEKTS